MVEDERDLDRRLAMAAVHYAARGVGWSCWICEDQFSLPVLKRSDGIFVKYGMHLLTSAPGMVADPILGGGRRAAIECRRVRDAKTRLDFADVGCVVFVLPFRVSEAIYGQPGYWSSGMRGYVAYWKGKAVAVVSTVLAGGAVGVYSWEPCRNTSATALERRFCGMRSKKPLPKRASTGRSCSPRKPGCRCIGEWDIGR